MKLIAQFLVTTLTLLLAPALTHSQSNDDLTVSKAMRIFGRSLMPADRLASGAGGTRQSRDVTEIEIGEAVSGIETAISTAEQVLAVECSQALLPTRINSLGDAARAEYSARYHGYFRQFLTALKEYKALFKNLLEVRPEERNFNSLDQKRIEIRNIVNESHANL